MNLETKRLIIKPSSQDTFESVYALFSDVDVMHYIVHGVKTREETREYLAKMISHAEKHGFGFGDIYEKQSGEYVGRAGLRYLAMNDQQPEIEMGYALHKKFWKKGYATELAKSLIDWAFHHLSVKKVVAIVHPENTTSRLVLEKAGMHYLGREICDGTEVAKYEILKNEINFDDVRLTPASFNDYPIIQNLARFYAYDISEHYGHEIGWEIEDDGLYCVGIDYRKYWETKDCFPFLIRYKNELAGFAIIDKIGSDKTIDFNMAQFFVLRTYKRKGIGKYIAYQCFNKFPGVWEVMVMPRNERAYRFWRKIIGEYTHHRYIEYSKKLTHIGGSKRNIFKFDSSKIS
ncbi:MAG: hypothetical protein ACD_46C00587G0002 [uncultured bacterium]|nr:MAG: hypothetical protein ACD_46C00587G0002 [uncultured bacterium]